MRSFFGNPRFSTLYSVMVYEYQTTFDSFGGWLFDSLKSRIPVNVPHWFDVIDENPVVPPWALGSRASILTLFAF